jgi:transcriptional repressor NrdR
MNCPSCKYPDSHVIRTIHKDDLNKIERRRECIKCGDRFTTYENIRPPRDNYK